MVALSVSISAMTSPVDTLSPFFFFQVTSVPSVMVSLNFGIWISGMTISSLGVTDFLYRAHDLIGAGQDSFLEPLVVRHGHIFLADTGDWRIELVENVLLNPIANFRPDPAEGAVLFGYDDAMSLSDRVVDSFLVERLNRTQVQNLGADLFFLELFGCG